MILLAELKGDNPTHVFRQIAEACLALACSDGKPSTFSRKGCKMTTEERVEILERELAAAKRRTLFLLGGAGLCLGIALLVWAFDGRTRSVLGLYDENGALRAELGVSKDGPGLWLYDKNLTPLAVLAVTKAGPLLRLHDENGVVRTVVGVTKAGPRLGLRDENGKLRVVVGVTKGAPVLGLHDKNGTLRAQVGVTKAGPALGLIDENGKFRAALDVNEDGPRLGLYDENENIRAVVGAGTTKTPGGRTVTYPESSIRLLDEDGKAIWQAP